MADRGFTAVIDIPPSTNNLYLSVSYTDKKGRSRCRRVLTAEGRVYKEQIGWVIKAAAMAAGWEYQGGGIEMCLDMAFKSKRRRDVTNCIKIVEDAAAEALNFDDCIVDDFRVRRIGIDRQSPQGELTIWETDRRMIDNELGTG